jgi:hypothetical protein
VDYPHNHFRHNSDWWTMLRFCSPYFTHYAFFPDSADIHMPVSITLHHISLPCLAPRLGNELQRQRLWVK